MCRMGVARKLHPYMLHGSCSVLHACFMYGIYVAWQICCMSIACIPHARVYVACVLAFVALMPHLSILHLCGTCVAHMLCACCMLQIYGTYGTCVGVCCSLAGRASHLNC